MRPLVTILVIITLAATFNAHTSASPITISNSNSQGISLSVSTSQSDLITDVNGNYVFTNSESQETGTLKSKGMPDIPTISKLIVVPPQAGLKLTVISGNPAGNSLYPPTAAELGKPVVFRGVRLARLTFYPVQYNAESHSFVHNDRIDICVDYTDDNPINPVADYRNLKNISPIAEKILSGLGVDRSQLPHRDATDLTRDYKYHYLVVAHSECLPHAIPLIEWKRQSGSKVDILSFDGDDALNEEFIKESIQEVYDSYLEQGVDPFDYIFIIGDREGDRPMNEGNDWCIGSFRGRPSTPGENHADYMFACLSGEDDFPDVGLARLASGNSDLMQLAVNRTLSYEKTPDLQNNDWYSTACLGTEVLGEDWSETITLTALWGYEVLQRVGYTDIQTFLDGDPLEYAGNLAHWLNETQPSLIISRSNVQSWQNDVENILNHHSTIFPVVLNFGGHGEFAMHRAFRTGTGDDLRGAVAWATGWGRPATLYSNSLWLSMISGVLMHDMPIGWGRTFGLASLYRRFGDIEDLQVYRTEFDMYGDPGIQPWIGIPQQVEIIVDQAIAVGSNSIEVSVIDHESDLPVSEADVTAYIAGAMPDPEDYADWQPVFMATGKTADDGKVLIPINVELPEEDLVVTVMGRKIYPAQRAIQVSNDLQYVGIASFSINDTTTGNGNGEVNVGERFKLNLELQNFYTDPLNGLHASIRSLSPVVVVADSLYNLGNLNANQSVRIISPIINAVPYAVNGSKPVLAVDVTGDQGQFTSTVVLEIHGADLVASSANIAVRGHGDEDNPAEPRRDDLVDILIEPNERAMVSVELANQGSVNSLPVTAELISHDWKVKVFESDVSYPQIGRGRTGLPNNNNRFDIMGNILAPGGSKSLMSMILRSATGIIDTATFSVTVGSMQANTPHPPDDYGYVALDDRDFGWALRPNYEFEAQYIGGPAADIRGIPFYNNNAVDVAYVLPTPFPIIFYGDSFDSITVCNNGFIAMGSQRSMVNYQEYPLDMAIGGGVGMVAPFWDKLIVSGDNSPALFYCYDTTGHRFFIEWYNVHHVGSIDTNITFNVAFEDPQYHPNATGDCNIRFTYKNVHRNPAEYGGNVPYEAIGISNPDGRTGINYSFGNVPHPTSRPITQRMAIFFTTIPDGHPNMTLLNDGLFDREYLHPDTMATRYLKLTNTGTGPAIYSVTKPDDAPWLILPENSRSSVPTGDTTMFAFNIDPWGLNGDLETEVTLTDVWTGKQIVIPVRINVDPANGLSNPAVTPAEWSLDGNYPNPFNSSTSIRYSVKETGKVKLSVYDIEGRLVQKLVDEHKAAGIYSQTLSNTGLSSGVYFYRMEAGNFTSTRKMIMLR